MKPINENAHIVDDDGPRLRRPWSHDAEWQVIMCAMTGRSALAQARALGIQTPHFHEIGHSRIWQGLLALADAVDGDYDSGALIEWLRARGWIDKVGGLEVLRKLDTDVLRGSLKAQAEIVVTLARIRAVQTEARIVSLEADGDIGDPRAWLASVSQRFAAKAETTRPRSVVSFADTLKQSWEALHSPERGGYATGLRGFDAAVGGLHPSEVVLLSAKEKAGKSVIVGQWLASIARRPVFEGARLVQRGRAAIVFALDAAKSTDWAERIAAAHAQVDLELFRLNRAEPADFEALSKGIEFATKIPVYIDSEHVATIGQMGARIRGLREELAAAGTDLSAVAIDYMQLANGEGPNREQQIGSAMRAVVGLAKVPDLAALAWVLISQTNTEGDLAHCKALAQMADAWVHLTVDDDKPEEGTWPNTARGAERVTVYPARLEIKRGRRGRMGARAKPIPLWCCYKFTFFFDPQDTL